jgi:hypothetical protein
MGVYLAVAAGLMSLSVIIRVIRFALALVLVALVVDLVTGYGPVTATALAHLL